MKQFLHLFIFSFVFSCFAFTMDANAESGKPWSVGNPFEHKAFIENKGQFDGKDNVSGKILYGIRQGSTFIYFSTTGVTYQVNNWVEMTEEEREEMMKGKEEEHEEEEEDMKYKMVSHYAYMKWQGANPECSIEPGETAQGYFMYPNASNTGSIKATAFKKITYRNLYPGIDVEYTFPENKEGFKYAFILHPGADVSLIKMKYSGEAFPEADNDGNIVIRTDGGNITDHAPLTYYADNSAINSAFVLDNKTVSFRLDNYDASRMVIIDPWSTVPSFAGYNGAYDLEYDLAGNVYVYGGSYPFQVQQFNSSGVLQWTYTGISFYSSGCFGACYGDFAVDGISGSSYLVEGFNGGLGARVIKLNQAGAQVGFFPGDNNLGEMWRIVYNNCTHESIIAGGGTSAVYQACILDTNVSTMTPVNVLSAAGALHDMCLLALDNFGNYYMNAARSLSDPSFADNALIKGPTATLIPLAWNVYSAHNFAEISSTAYVNGGTGAANGFNGIAVSPNFLYTYDGNYLKKWNSVTGARIDSVQVSSTTFAWGGLAVDECDNIYVGDSASVSVYDVNLSLTGSIPMPNVVYDLKLGPQNKIYASGFNFVAEALLSTVPCNPLNVVLDYSGNCTAVDAWATVTGGTGPYSYSWTPSGQTGQTATGLSPGTHYFTVMDNSCIPKAHTDSVVIPPGGGSLTLNMSPFSVSCFGGSNGSASVVASGGTAPYTYTWTTVPPQTSATATGLPAGNYTVSVTDLNGCSSEQYVTVTQPTQLTSTIPSSTNVSCFGGSNGTAVAAGSGGTPGYTYSWNTVPVQVGITATGLSATTYTVTVSDLNGCSTTSTVTLTQPTALAANGSLITNVSCFGGNNGSVTVTASGGIPGYTYTWSPSGGNGVTASNLTAGTYTVTVRDLNGCTITSTAVVTQPPVLAANGSLVSNVSCNGGANGSVTVTANGGSPGYTYTWSPSGGNGVTASNLTAGTYTVTVRDVNGCTITSTAVVTQPAALVANSSTVANVSCFGGNNGSVSVSVNGGSPGYTYTWSPSGGNGATASSLTAGTYTVTVRDLNGCSITTTAVVTQPTAVAANTTILANVLCNGGNNGSASVTANGGTPGYSYTWTPSGGNGATANSLTAGTYTVTVRDLNGCTITSTAIITQPSVLAANGSTLANVLCNGGNNGSVTVSVSGGIPNYSYTWSPSGGNGATASNLIAGNYSVVVSDANGCTITANAVVTQASTLGSNAATLTNILCNGGNNGSASVSANGGSPGYSYSWSPSGGNGTTASNLIAGTYSVVVTDANGCTTVSTAIITEPTILAATASTVTNVTCFGGSNGSATVSPSGGTSGYTYSWLPSGGNSPTASNLPIGTYTVIVTDANGCFTGSTATITEPPQLTANGSNVTNVSCFGGSDGSVTVSSSGGNGSYSYSWSPSGGNAITASNLSIGTYTVTVTDNNGCSVTSLATVTQPLAVAATTDTLTSVSCNGGNDGAAFVLPSGGISPFSFAWTPSGGSNATASNLAAGNYSVTVTDANGCSIIRTVIISQPTPLSLTTSGSVTICNSQSTIISATPGGGSAPYAYSWDNGPVTASQTVSPVSTTNYSVIVTDANGCTITQALTVTVHPPLNITAAATPQICVGSSGTVSSTAGGGNGGPYSYVWNTGQTTSSFPASPVVSTTYTVTLTDGCSPPVTSTASIIVNPLPIVAFIPVSSAGCVPVSVDFASDTLNAIPGSTFQWNFGDGTMSTDTNPSHDYTVPGTYGVTLTITTPAGCTNTLALSNVVTAVAFPEADFSIPRELSLEEAALVQFTNLSTGSSSWTWDFGDESDESDLFSPAHGYTDTGSYTVQLISYNDYLCPDTAYRTIKVKGEFAIYIPNTFTPNGDGRNDGFTAYGIYIREFDMWILDRWGAKIYHSQSINDPWNGTYFDNGTLCQNDVYVYKIKVRDDFGKPHEFVGHVSLVR
jgi:gliding motility-associated-like protein